MPHIVSEILKTALRIRYVLVLTGIVVGATLGMLNALWQAEASRSQDRLDHYVVAQADFLSAIGYGGLIHNFKNYLLRGSEHYRVDAIANYDSAVDALNRLAAIAPEDVTPMIGSVQTTLRSYRDNLDVAAVAIRRGAVPLGLDQLVKIDDTLAISHLSRLLVETNSVLTHEQTLRLRALRTLVAGNALLLVSVLLLVAVLLMQGARLNPIAVEAS